jgi:hypothetical protein
MESLVVQATCIDYDRLYLQTIFEEEEPSAADEKQVTGITKVCTHFLQYIQLCLFITFSAICLDAPSVSSTQAVFCKGYCPCSTCPKLNICIACDQKECFCHIL